jgi:hypothetical protein
MKNSKITTKVTSDAVNVKYGNAVIENCEFIGGDAEDTDAIDYDDVEMGIIKRNIIHDFLGANNDGIDIGEGAINVSIIENLIYNCEDKGISIGQGSSAILTGNIIASCGLGVGIKDEQSYGSIDHNTFFENVIAVSCFEKTLGKGGGKAEISNTIFSQSVYADIYADDFSEIDVQYSLSDRSLLNGVGNIFGEPEFMDIASMNFAVKNTSPAIDNGDPDYNLDPDGSRTNIGAFYTNFINSNEIIITEINYHSSSDFDSKDWIELYNPNDFQINLSNWVFKDANDEHRFILPNNLLLSGESFIILCEDSLQFRSMYNNVEKVLGNFDFGLSNGGEHVRLFDNYGNIIDSLTYDDELPWPIDADGAGYTLQLNDYSTDNSLGKNWNSTFLHGTPGKINILVDVEETLELPNQYSLLQNYPNPFNPSTTINYSIPESIKIEGEHVTSGFSLNNVTLKIYDILGREISTLLNEKQRPGNYTVVWDAGKHPSGLYFYRLVIDNVQITKKMMLIK